MHSDEIASELNTESTATGRTPAFESILRRHGLAPLRRRGGEDPAGERRQALQSGLPPLPRRRRTEAHRAMYAPTVASACSWPCWRRARASTTVDITGGAPELNPHSAYLVERGPQPRPPRHRPLQSDGAARARHGMTCRSFCRAHDVELVCSLPCYTAENVERQRGRGVFDKSIAALRRLNASATASPARALRLDLVYNPLGASLPPPQERARSRLQATSCASASAIEFHHLLTITNMPIKRFAEQLGAPRTARDVHGPARRRLQPGDRARPDVPHPGQRRLGRARSTTATSTRCSSCRSRGADARGLVFDLRTLRRARGSAAIAPPRTASAAPPAPARAAAERRCAPVPATIALPTDGSGTCRSLLRRRMKMSAIGPAPSPGWERAGVRGI